MRPEARASACYSVIAHTMPCEFAIEIVDPKACKTGENGMQHAAATEPPDRGAAEAKR